MKITTIACSRQGFGLMKDFQKKWLMMHPKDCFEEIVRCKSLSDGKKNDMAHGNAGIQTESLTERVGQCFQKSDALIFFTAAGIAVRSIAGFLVHKSEDPAVIAVDETGRFAVSLLSGHAGGANELTEQVAEVIGALPVITTATDREGKFAVDEFARKNQLIPENWKAAKEISVRVLEGLPVGFFSELKVEGELPRELTPVRENMEWGIVISEKMRDKSPAHRWFSHSLQLIPKNIIAGIGCRKGSTKEQIAAAMERCFFEQGIRMEALLMLTSIDLKKEEAGISSFCREQGLPFRVYSAGELKQVEGSFTESSFVARTTGVGNVCERSAVLAGGELICKKRAYDGVTVALAKREGSVRF